MSKKQNGATAEATSGDDTGAGTGASAGQQPLNRVGDALDAKLDASLARMIDGITGVKPVDKKAEEAKATKAGQDEETDAGQSAAGDSGLKGEETETTEGAQGTERAKQGTDGPDETNATDEGAAEGAEEALEVAPEVQEKINRRIGKEVRKTKEAQAALAAAQGRIDQLEGELTEAKSGRPTMVAVTPEFGPLSDVTSPEQIEGRVAEAWRVKHWADSHSKGAELPDGKGGTVTLDEEQVARVRANAVELIHRFAPARREYLQQASNYDARAVQYFPWLKDRKSAEYGLFTQVTQQWPELQARPGWKLAAAVYVLGLQTLKAQQDAAGKAKSGGQAAPSKKPPVKQPGSPGAGGANPVGNRASAKDEQAAKATNRFLSKPTVENLAEAIKGL